MDVMNVTFAHVVQALAVVIVLYEVFKKVMEIKKDSDAEHARRMSWDKAAKTIEERADLWNKGLADMEQGRKNIVERYDERLDEQDAKIQQLYTMMIMLMRSQNAVLEALIEQGIGNGEIKAMHTELNSFITEQIGK